MKRESYDTLVGIFFTSFFCLVTAYLLFFKDADPNYVMIAGGLIILFSVVVIGLSIFQLKYTWSWGKQGTVGIFLGFLAIALAVAFAGEPFFNRKNLATQSNYASICGGRGIPIATAYRADGFNPLVVIDPPNHPGKWSAYAIRAAWTPTDLSGATLAACFQDEKVHQETCQYNGGVTVKRYQNRVNVKLVEVKTGNILYGKTFNGKAPGKCLAAVSSGGEIEGAGVEWGEIRSWMAEFVHPVNN